MQTHKGNSNALPGTAHTRISAFVPAHAQVLAIGGDADSLVAERSDCSVRRIEASSLASIGNEQFDAVLLSAVLEDDEDPATLLRQVRPLLSDEGAVVASIRNAGHGSVRLALLAGRFNRVLDKRPRRLFTRETIEDLFEENGYIITHWARERSEIEGSATLGGDSIRELLARDPESTTSTFAVRAVPSDAAGQLAAAHAELRAARDELEALRRSSQDAEGLTEELEAVRRAHEERGKRLVAERLEFANELGELQRHLEALHRSRSFRYTAPLRSFFRLLRGRR